VPFPRISRTFLFYPHPFLVSFMCFTLVATPLCRLPTAGSSAAPGLRCCIPAVNTSGITALPPRFLWWAFLVQTQLLHTLPVYFVLFSLPFPALSRLTDTGFQAVAPPEREPSLFSHSPAEPSPLTDLSPVVIRSRPLKSLGLSHLTTPLDD